MLNQREAHIHDNVQSTRLDQCLATILGVNHDIEDRVEQVQICHVAIVLLSQTRGKYVDVVILSQLEQECR